MKQKNNKAPYVKERKFYFTLNALCDNKKTISHNSTTGLFGDYDTDDDIMEMRKEALNMILQEQKTKDIQITYRSPEEYGLGFLKDEMNEDGIFAFQCDIKILCKNNKITTKVMKWNIFDNKANINEAEEMKKEMIEIAEEELSKKITL